MKRILAGVACLFIIGHVVHSQSIYSFQGLGSLNHQGMPNNVAMGEVGIGTPSYWSINTQNPANLVYNNFSTFQVGLELDRRRFSGDGVSGKDTDGGLRFLGYAFPVIQSKWTSSFGVLPYSSVSYNTFTSGTVSGTNDEVIQVTDNRGEGGLTNFFWANGFRIKNKLLLGVKATYTFGSIKKTSTVAIAGEDVAVSNVSYEELESYSDINFLFGLGYRYDFTEKTFLNLGLTYSPKTAFDGTSELSLIRLSNSGSEIETVDAGKESIEFDLPNTFGIGLSYQKLNSFIIGLDVELQQWASAGSDLQEYGNTIKIAVGGEWIPDINAINSYWKRIRYAAGFNYAELPYILNDQTLSDFGINFGGSLPVRGFSNLDLAFKWGQLGKSSDGLIKETYYKIVIGATINDRWFIKRKYD